MLFIMLLGSCVVVNVVVYERLPLRHKKLNKQTIKQTTNKKCTHTKTNENEQNQVWIQGFQ